jgi:hypothetical protein
VGGGHHKRSGGKQCAAEASSDSSAMVWHRYGHRELSLNVIDAVSAPTDENIDV